MKGLESCVEFQVEIDKRSVMLITVEDVIDVGLWEQVVLKEKHSEVDIVLKEFLKAFSHLEWEVVAWNVVHSHSFFMKIER